MLNEPARRDEQLQRLPPLMTSPTGVSSGCAWWSAG